MNSEAMKKMMEAALLVALAFGLASGVWADDDERANLIRNGNFENWSGNRPQAWSQGRVKHDLSKAETDEGAALQVDIVGPGSGGQGEVRQNVRVKRNTVYRLEGQIRGSKRRTAFIQVKLRAGGQELERIGTPWNAGQDWQEVSLEIDSAGADTLQVLCRFEQRASHVGETAWFTGLRLVEAGESPDAEEARAAVEQHVKELAVPGVADRFGERRLSVAHAGQDAYVTPDGAGSRDGGDWANAMAASDGGLQRAWDAAGPGDTVHLGSGSYREVTLRIAAGGADHFRPITLQGVDTGAGLPRVASSWDRSRPGQGKVFVNVSEDVGFVRISDIQVTRYKTAVDLNGRNVGVRITNVDVEHTRDAFIFNGRATPDAPYLGSEDLVLQDCQIKGYTKRGLRIRGGVSWVRVLRCDADAGGSAYYAESFPMGFHVEGSQIPGVYDHDIVYISCTSRNNHQTRDRDYWNGDGFAAERNVYNITWIDCEAYDNTDGGWDVKARNPVLINCIAMRNKRNFRFWSHGPVTMTNCLAAHTIKRGGTGNTIGLHLNRNVRVFADRCTLVNNGTAIEVMTTNDRGETRPSIAELRECILAEDRKLVEIDKAGVVRFIDCVIERQLDSWPEGVSLTGVVYTSPGLPAPAPDWEGGDGAYDSTSHPDRGYRQPR